MLASRTRRSQKTKLRRALNDFTEPLFRLLNEPSSSKKARRGLFLERLEDRTTPSTYSVTNTLDSGAGSLRQAILNANVHANQGGPDVIAFNISGNGVHTITPSTPLPTITDAVIVDGYSQPGSSPNTLATGENAVLQIDFTGQLTITAAGSTIKGLAINDSEQNGIEISGPSASGNMISGNFIGSNAPSANV